MGNQKPPGILLGLIGGDARLHLTTEAQNEPLTITGIVAGNCGGPVAFFTKATVPNANSPGAENVTEAFQLKTLTFVVPLSVPANQANLIYFNCGGAQVFGTVPQASKPIALGQITSNARIQLGGDATGKNLRITSISAPDCGGPVPFMVDGKNQTEPFQNRTRTFDPPLFVPASSVPSIYFNCGNAVIYGTARSD